MTEAEQSRHPAPPARSISLTDFTNWGVSVIAYVRAERDGGWAIHAADGTLIGAAPNRDVAFAAIRGHDLEPHSVH
jgi:hypothetical protein